MQHEKEKKESVAMFGSLNLGYTQYKSFPSEYSNGNTNMNSLATTHMLKKQEIKSLWTWTLKRNGQSCFALPNCPLQSFPNEISYLS